MWNEEINMLNIMDFVKSQKQNGLSFSWKVYEEDLQRHSFTINKRWISFFV